MIWDKLNAAIDANQSFLISSHLSLDGDSVGSQLAFYWYLTSKGKEVVLYNHDPLPSKFHFLGDSEILTNKKPEKKFDVLTVLDCSNQRRLGWSGHEEIAPFVINVDHHRDNTMFGNVNIVQTNAAATAELIYHFLVHNKSDFPPHVAESLYTAIMTDTGGFRFSNTNSGILRICADLADRGVNCSKVYERVYSSHSQRALLLQSRIWSTLKFFFGGKVCSMELPLGIIDELGAQYSDSEGMADYTITAEDVEIGIMAKHTENESHFSLRSKGKIDVGKIAQKIPGGGGHSSAAGCTIEKPYPEAFAEMLKIIEQELR
jgi:phosphoesterase RecJ-like protein